MTTGNKRDPSVTRAGQTCDFDHGFSSREN
jgi:hypothetical protein